MEIKPTQVKLDKATKEINISGAKILSVKQDKLNRIYIKVLIDDIYAPTS